MSTQSISFRVACRCFTAARYTLPRKFYIPAEVRDVKPETPAGTDLVLWRYEKDLPNGSKRYLAIGFAGKQNKPLFNYYYTSEASRDAHVKGYIENRKAVLKMKADQLKERREFKHEFEVGDILVASWGYDQTNVDFFKVLEIVGPKTVKIVSIGKKLKDEGRVGDTVLPDPKKVIGKPMNVRVSPGHRVKIDNVRSAGKWSGRPMYETAFGYGH